MPDLGRSGGDRLSRALGHSTMGAGGFHGRVRDGIGWDVLRFDHQTGEDQGASGEWRAANGACRPSLRLVHHSFVRAASVSFRVCVWLIRTWIMRATKLDRAISTGQLNASPRLHLRPIDVVVFHGSQGSSRFEVGFPLRCLQRLSRPHVATLRCGWRHNRSTRGASIPVLSY